MSTESEFESHFALTVANEIIVLDETELGCALGGYESTQTAPQDQSPPPHNCVDDFKTAVIAGGAGGVASGQPQAAMAGALAGWAINEANQHGAFDGGPSLGPAEYTYDSRVAP